MLEMQNFAQVPKKAKELEKKYTKKCARFVSEIVPRVANLEFVRVARRSTGWPAMRPPIASGPCLHVCGLLAA